jgi:4-oxalocrotonate tautomerase
MPLVRISLRQGKSEQYRRAIADGVHQAMVESIDALPQDRFQVITEHTVKDLIYDPSYLGIERSDDVVIVQITLSGGRKPAQKRRLFQRMAEMLAKDPGLRPQDLMINLVEPGRIGRLVTERRSTPGRPECADYLPPLPSATWLSGTSFSRSRGTMSWVWRHSA